MDSRQVVAVFMSLVCATIAGADVRSWSDATGKFHSEAELADFQNGVAYLKEANGRIVAVTLNRLSLDDRDYIGSTISRVEVLKGKAVGITDGDTLTLLDGQQHQVKIRLEGIDAPESHQAYGTLARKALAGKAFEKDVVVESHGQDKYGRTLGHVFIGSRWINKELVQEGWAWHYREYSKSAVLADAESEARTKHAGLWQDDKPVAPWDFRHPPAQSSVAVAQPASPSAAPTVSLKPQSSKPTDEQTVYVTKTGTKYHAPGCRHLSKSSIPIKLSDASAKYSPCSVCHPSVVKTESSDNTLTSVPSRSSSATSIDVDRNPDSEAVTGHTANGIPTYTGPRGGHYHYSKSGKKVYERKK
ncbi:MAG TPA: thermonuclease family protein [Pirellulales bacterium]|jgi:endonuclease YncB( thermonuclease family)